MSSTPIQIHDRWLLNCEPREVQLEALNRSYFCDGGPKRGWGHFMEMRLGKTPAALNEYLLLRRDTDIRRMLVIAPCRSLEMTGEMKPI